MATVIREQIVRGVFLSRHLQDGGFDVRSEDMTAEDKAAFKEAVAQNTNLLLLEEGIPPHFHVQLKHVPLHLNAIGLIREEVPFLVKVIPSELTQEEDAWLKSTFKHRSHL
jgi:hypothetical protein